MNAHLPISLLLVSLFLPGIQEPVAAGVDSKPIAPLFKNLGRHHWKVTTRYELAQRYFDQGLTLLYNFNHAEAIRSFDASAQIDPECAMAQWGISLAHGPNINAPMFPEAVQPAWDALQRAIALKPKATQKEQALIDALAKRYAEKPPADRSALNQAYADAMRDAAKRYVEDDEIQIFFAEAVMDTAPWNYWTPDQQLKPAASEAVAAIERVLGRVKEHPGANHLYIHLVEAGPNPEKGVPSAERLAALAPAAGHLVHMPSHIFLRVGRYHDAASWNVDAINVDEFYMRKAKPKGVYPGGYYSHNVHFYWYATMMEGRSRESMNAANKLALYTLDLRCGAIEGVRQRYVPLLTRARFGRFDELLRMPSPESFYPFDRAMAHFARGLAFSAKGGVSDAEIEFGKFVELEKSDAVKSLDNPFFPGAKILAVARELLAGKVDETKADTRHSIEHLRRAVELEDAMPYMEPPFWHYSTRLTLGAALVRAGQFTDAERTFREDVKRHPNSGWGLFGLEQSLRKAGRTPAADQARNEFKNAWHHADVKPDLAWY